jgi:hypothetical protein
VCPQGLVFAVAAAAVLLLGAAQPPDPSVDLVLAVLAVADYLLDVSSGVSSSHTGRPIAVLLVRLRTPIQLFVGGPCHQSSQTAEKCGAEKHRLTGIFEPAHVVTPVARHSHRLY